MRNTYSGCKFHAQKQQMIITIQLINNSYKNTNDEISKNTDEIKRSV